MRQIDYQTNDEDLARILECVESSMMEKMETVGKSADMFLRAAVHTHCGHLNRIAADIRYELTPNP